MLSALSSDEVRKIAESAMGYELRGRNWTASPATIIPHDVVDDIARVAGKDCATVLLVWITLKRNHSHTDKPFAFSPSAMAAKEVIPGIRCRKALERARAALIEAGLLIKAGEKTGRNGYHLPLYRLSKTARVKVLH